MKTSITNELVRRTKPSDKPFRIRDSRLKGLIFRVQPTGAMSYYIECARGSRERIGPADALTPDQAREAAFCCTAQPA
ncbi:MAG: Arm DNA-binding domain-containing protein [Candidatus Obscuribacterales bacterium]|nr:Arm DNA-binding domain-containing protein [Candidatus Obscuribacterales bacterium]